MMAAADVSIQVQARLKIEQSEKALEQLNAELEERVLIRTRELQLAQAEAERQRARLESFLMQAPAIIAVHDGPDLVFELINPLYQKMFSGRKLLGKSLLEGLTELAGTPIWDILQEVFRTGKTYEGKEVLVPLAPYENAPLENNYYNFICQARYNEYDQVDGVMVFAYDVTDLVKAKKAVEASAEHFLFMANVMPQKVWTADASGEINYANTKWLEYIGLPFEELEDWRWKAIIHPDDMEVNVELWRQSISTGKDFEMEHRLKSFNGDYRWHLSRSLAYRNGEGKVTMWVGTSTDIHDHKVAERALQDLSSELAHRNEELKDANKTIQASKEDLEVAYQQLKLINADLDNFIYAASHDLKAPIFNIEGLMQALQSELPKESLELEPVAPIVSMMYRAIERFKKTISNLTEISMLQKENSLEETVVPIAAVVEEVILDLNRVIQSSGAVLEVDLQKSDTIFFSEKNLRSVIYNLISNAIKYASPDRVPRIRLRYEEKQEHKVLYIEDNGLGMKEAQKQQLFTMFKRFHDHVEGSGIGLYMVKRIMENAGGKIEVESTENEGTTFRVYFKK